MRSLYPLRLCLCVVVHKDGKNARPYVFTVHSQHFSSHPVQSLDVSADGLEEMINWVSKIREAAQSADARVRIGRPRGPASACIRLASTARTDL